MTRKYSQSSLLEITKKPCMDFWKLEEAVDIHGEVALSQALQQHAQFLRYMGMVASGITFSFALWFVTLVIL